MKKIHIEERTATIMKHGKVRTMPMHDVYLCDGGRRIYLCSQRRYQGVSQYFRRDLPVDAIHRHKWGRDKMVDNLMAKLPKYLSDAERHYDDYAA